MQAAFLHNTYATHAYIKQHVHTWMQYLTILDN